MQFERIGFEVDIKSVFEIINLLLTELEGRTGEY